jgi:hypothetical protein
MGSIEQPSKGTEVRHLEPDISAASPGSLLTSIALPDYVARAGTTWPWDDDQVFCPECAAQTRLFMDVLDSRNGKRYRVFACQCGEVVWLDK